MTAGKRIFRTADGQISVVITPDKAWLETIAWDGDQPKVEETPLVEATEQVFDHRDEPF